MSIRKDVHMVTRSLDMKLRVLRAERQLSLREASARTGVDKVALSRYERGLGRPQDLTLAKIAKGYGVGVEELLEEAVPLAEAPQETGQSGQEWARELDVTLHGMTDEEWTAHVRELDSVKELEEAFHTLLEETNTLHVAHSVYKEEHPEDKDRRIALSSDLRELRTSRFANLATE